MSCSLAGGGAAGVPGHLVGGSGGASVSVPGSAAPQGRESRSGRSAYGCFHAPSTVIRTLPPRGSARQDRPALCVEDEHRGRAKRQHRARLCVLGGNSCARLLGRGGWSCGYKLPVPRPALVLAGPASPVLGTGTGRHQEGEC